MGGRLYLLVERPTADHATRYDGRMDRNAEIAAQFHEIADRLLLLGESWFKVRAYRRAAEIMRAADQDIAALSDAGHLTDLPGIGAAIAAKTADYLATGHIPLLDRLRERVPDGLLALLRVGLTPAQVRELHAAGIDSPETLRGRLAHTDLPISQKTMAAARAALAEAGHAQGVGAVGSPGGGPVGTPIDQPLTLCAGTPAPAANEGAPGRR